MSSNYEVLIRLFEENPDRFFREFRNSVDDGTLSDDDIKMLVKKLDVIQPIMEVDYIELCRLFKIDSSELRSKITVHQLLFLYGRGDLEKYLK